MSRPRSLAQAVVLHEDDDVAVLVESLEHGAVIAVNTGKGNISLHIRQALPLGHKIALRDLPTGHLVRKYGEVIGKLRSPVVAGEHIHVHNLASLRG